MPTKTEFVGYHKISGERIIKVHNPNGLMSVYAVEAGSGPYSGTNVMPAMIVATPDLVDGPAVVAPEAEAVVPVTIMPDTPELKKSVKVMQDANKKYE